MVKCLCSAYLSKPAHCLKTRKGIDGEAAGGSLNLEFGIYPSALTREVCMADAPRITVEELKRRMDAGEDFTVIDTRNPKAWAEADTVIPGAIRLPADGLESSLSKIPKNKPVVAYCT
jgi:adenylyltransferase/sulfurtransferase